MWIELSEGVECGAINEVHEGNIFVSFLPQGFEVGNNDFYNSNIPKFVASDSVRLASRKVQSISYNSFIQLNSSDHSCLDADVISALLCL